MRLIDADVLKDIILKWLPKNPCGHEELEHPYEEDICVSTLMTIEEQPTVDAVPIKDIEQVLSDIYNDKRNNSTELWYKDMCCDSDSGWAFEGMEFLLNVLKRYWGNKI